MLSFSIVLPDTRRQGEDNRGQAFSLLLGCKTATSVASSSFITCTLLSPPSGCERSTVLLSPGCLSRGGEGGRVLKRRGTLRARALSFFTVLPDTRRQGGDSRKRAFLLLPGTSVASSSFIKV